MNEAGIDEIAKPNFFISYVVAKIEAITQKIYVKIHDRPEKTQMQTDSAALLESSSQKEAGNWDENGSNGSNPSCFHYSRKFRQFK